MHDYLRAIGFSQIKENKDVRELLKVIMLHPTAEFVTSDKHSVFGEKVKEFASRMGIGVRGEYDEDGNSYEKKEETCLNYVQYEVDGKTYKDKLSLVSCNYDIGDEVGIYYDVDNPAIMEEKNNKYFLLFAFVLSTIFMSFIVVAGLKEMFSTVKSMKKTLKKKKNKKVTRKK